MVGLPVLTEQLILAERLYDGVTPAFQHDRAVLIRDGRVAEIRPANEADHARATIYAPIAAPGLIDIQINGAADVQFNFDPTPEAVATIARGARKGGTAHILPTFITAHGQEYLQAISAVGQAMKAGVRGIIGVHLEGPFLSPARPGIHDPSAIRPLDDTDVAALVHQAGNFPGVILLTLAPECQRAEDLVRLADAGIVLFAGHSEARARDLQAMRGVTHLWNAMPGPQSRVPGIVSEVLGGDQLFAGIIADGHHIGQKALTLSVRAAQDRLCLVTDAMLTLAGTVREFQFSGGLVTLTEGRLTGPDGTLAGAHIAMDESLRMLVKLTSIDPVSALKMASFNPAQALQLDNNFGKIIAGHTAAISIFDAELRALDVLQQ